MATRKNMVSDLKPSTKNPTIRLWVIRLWRTMSTNKKTDTTTIEIVFIDEQGTVNKELVANFENLIIEGSTIMLRDFDVEENSSTFKYSTYPYKIVFLATTFVNNIDSWDGSLHGFDFVSFEDILSNKVVDKQIVDIIGCVVHVGDIIPGEYNNKPNKRRTLQLTDLKGWKIEFTMWDAFVDEFSAFVKNQLSYQHVIMIIQFAKIRDWQGFYSVGTALFGTRLFINADIPEIHNLKQRMSAKKMNPPIKLELSSISTQIVPSKPTKFFENSTPVTLNQLQQIHEETECVTVATIRSIHKDKSWSYNACHRCTCLVTSNDGVGTSRDASKKLNNTWTCRNCGPNVTHVYPRYKVQIKVVDQTGSQSQLLFDRDVMKLINTSAYQMRGKIDATGDSFPEELEEIVGRKLLFVFKVSDFNLENNYYVYTVSKISKDETIINAYMKLYENEESDSESSDHNVQIENTASATLGKDPLNENTEKKSVRCSTSKMKEDVQSGPDKNNPDDSLLGITTNKRRGLMNTIKQGNKKLPKV